MKYLPLVAMLSLGACSEHYQTQALSDVGQEVIDVASVCPITPEQIGENLVDCCYSNAPRDEVYETIWCEEASFMQRHTDLLLSQSCAVRECFAGYESDPCRALTDECSWSQADHNAYLSE